MKVMGVTKHVQSTERIIAEAANFARQSVKQRMRRGPPARSAASSLASSSSPSSSTEMMPFCCSSSVWQSWCWML